MENIARSQIDWYSPMPLYQQIAFDLSTRISQCEWRVGEKIPSETELTAIYGVSRVTIHQALAKLKEDGYIEKQRGRGSFVKNRPETKIQDLVLPHPDNKPVRDVVSTNIRFSETAELPENIALQLRIPPNTPVIHLERNFERDHKVVAISKAWFIKEMVPGLGSEPLLDNSVATTLQKRYQIRYNEIHNYIEAVVMNLQVSQALGVPQQSPGLKIKSLYLNDAGLPFEYSETTWIAQDTQFHVLLSDRK